ncbi:phage tail tape measure protein [Kutzneria albida]|uniref:Phage tail tape measure protein domain-containing protein n=1 Tax=Kutzneria albida DSM 43870 TaxID=1449976 RepID=W5WC51_9PSEU|nr:phage tail tape measure protein [Kutzneria albida]AHH98335.1 hypothetical protein KALB_4973 [Kutzneria albida DSM 43870]
MAKSVGGVYLDIIPSVKNFGSLLRSSTIGDVEKVGKEVGSTFGNALSGASSDGVRALQSKLDQAVLATQNASNNMVRSQAAAETAAGKVRIAEQQLAEARVKYAADSSQVIAAEEKLAAAQRNSEIQASRSQKAQEALTAAEATQKDLTEKNAATQEASAASTSKLAGAATTLVTAVTAVGLAMGAVAVKEAADYQTELTRLVTSAGESTDAIKGVGDGILEMAGQVGISSHELAVGMYTIESAGYHSADGLVVLKAAAQGAKEENAQLGTVANAVTDILTDYHLPAQQAADVTSKLVTAVSLGKTNFEALSGAMSSVAPLAGAAHVPLQDLLGDLAEMTAHGVSADQAAQNLANTIRSLANPTNVMTQELSQLGIRSDDVSKNLGKTGVSGALISISDAIMQHMGPEGQVLLQTFNQSKIAAEDAQKMYGALPPSLQKIADQFNTGKISMNEWRQGLKALPADQAALLQQWVTMRNNAEGFSQALKSGSTTAQTYTQALAKATGNATSMNVALMLTGENAKSTLENIDKIAESTDEAGHNVLGWSEIQGNFNQKLDQTKAQLGAFMIAIGEKLLPVATQALDWVGNFVRGLIDMGKWISENSNWIGLIAAVIGGLAAPLLAVKLAMEAWALATKLVALAQAALNLVLNANPIMLIVTGIAALAAGLIYAYTHFEGFRNVVQAVGNFLKDVFLAVWHALGVAIDWVVDHWKIFATALAIIFAPITLIVGLFVLVISHAKQIGDALTTAAQAVGKAFVWLWETILKPVFDGIFLVFRVAAAIVAAFLVEPIVLLVKNVLAPAFVWLYTAIIKPYIDAIGAIVHWVWDNVIKVVIDYIVAGVRLWGAIFTWLYTSIIKPSFDAIGAIFHWVWDNVISPIIGYIQQGIQFLGAVVRWLWDSVIKPYFDAIGQIFNWIWNNVIQPVINYIKAGIQAWGDIFSWLYDHVIKPVGDAISAAVDGIRHGFELAVEGIKTAWNKVMDIVKVPAKFIVDLVYNDAIVPLWNGVAHLFGLGDLNPVKTSAWAGGGVLPGYAPGIDSIPAMLSPGEAVLTPEAVRFLGTDTILGLNAMSGRTGGNQANGIPVHAAGGWLGDAWNALSSGAQAVWHGITDAASWVASLAGDIVGGVTKLFEGAIGKTASTPGGSSEWRTALTDIPGKVVQGAIDKVRSWFAAGNGAQYTAGAGVQQWKGVVDQALTLLGQPLSMEQTVLRRMQQESGGNPSIVNTTDSNWAAGTPSVGLMQVIGPTFGAYAGPYAGTGPFSYGVSTNPLANVYSGLNYALHRYGSLSALNQAGGYDDGGWLQPGITPVINASGRPEPVFSAGQWQTLKSAVASGNAGGEHHYHVTTHDPASVAAEIERRQRSQMLMR